jgi:small-conductance mechanosensitive channel
MERLRAFWRLIEGLASGLYKILNTPFAHLGETPVSVNSVLFFILSILLLFYIAKKARELLVNKILSRTKVEEGIRQSIGTIIRYAIIVFGLIIIFQSAGLNLSALGVVAGALGVGIGFGLQNITNNFISGLIILFERPIKIGDRVEIGESSGDVVRIAARATTIITNDNISIIIPNSEFISSKVINWSHNNRMIRYRIPVGVSYNEDPDKIKALLLEVAARHEGVLKSPAPSIMFREFGDSSLNFEMWVWTIKYTNRPIVLQSDLYYSIFQEFKKQGIEIPFPQRDLHIRSGIDFLQPPNDKH